MDINSEPEIFSTKKSLSMSLFIKNIKPANDLFFKLNIGRKVDRK